MNGLNTESGVTGLQHLIYYMNSNKFDYYHRSQAKLEKKELGCKGCQRVNIRILPLGHLLTNSCGLLA